MKRRKITHDDGVAAIIRVVSAQNVDDIDEQDIQLVCRYLLQELEISAEGASVEVRIPPYGAIQCIQGSNHRRGTPPNVVEMPPMVWIKVATGQIDFLDHISSGDIYGSGEHFASVANFLPIVPLCSLKSL
ncbi:MAG: sterol carrier family protein [Candidatus Ancillula sp.]|nr:sterol carrier family protein [Candidatus Ancillula sp.]